jgi:threonine dehydrogenase-like Zn-dependent dehydrogenase
MMVELAEKSLIGKAVERPDLVRRVIDKVKNEGLFSTIEAVRSRLDNPMALGYSSAGIVLAVGEGVDNFQPGDRVACAGAGYASHAEVVFVPKNLAVKIPDGVDFESASFTTLGAIAIQGLRLADVRLGETVAVIGLGLVGLLTVQLAKAAGCRVVGMDPNPERCRLATQLGCDAALADNSQFAIRNSQFTNGHGADAVLITASTKSNDPVDLAGQVARDRGMVVAVGLVGMDIPRKLYYEKELTFRVSRSYGPGRYDSKYEEKGQDYPIAYVRWTENRNMQAFVQLLAEGKVNIKPLITHRFPIDEAIRAYDLITAKTKEPYLGILLAYSETDSCQKSVVSSQ